MLLVTCVIFGLSVGNLLMLQPLLLADAFGVREYPRIYSFAQLITTIGVGVGPSAMGVLHDLSDYRLSYLVAAGSSALAFVLFLAAGPAEQHQRVVAERAAAAAVPA